ncbi:MAG: type II toxin-antitoxin system VapC family toxin [Cellulomonadaceae bacterium]|jgi:predicted nucleic-acid-binding protein|nr:type II toxin-antitoxin system VapC family toxin [Cellulomonadaceae bacterium]
MIGLDTNVLVRAIVEDDPVQSAQAQLRLMNLSMDEPGFVPHIVLVELWWVLTRFYKYSPSQAVIPLSRLCELRNIVVQNPILVKTAIKEVTDYGADFADALIVAVARSEHCQRVETFDRQAIARAGMAPLPA